ncbi:HET-domain-containing protein [Cubamyces sp. BRFM 1775]|nr:HET-domain-containing protein [Cubamyces sp. BRFM 1775]
MYLLSTEDGTLHECSGPHALPYGEHYAILSHVWLESGEQSFQELQILVEKDAGLDRASPKIRDFCAFARLEGYAWVWIDSCCIDKTSSAELSEAINSMFAWYAAADVCFAYLADVGDEEDPNASDSQFRRSRWFTRGWTLQELIAPQILFFISRDWSLIGTKTTLAPLVEEITGIDRAILTRQQKLDSVSVARRMSWASRRKTTRIEDKAYSLLGIFGIHMATIYGEGENAFLRLQEEILKRVPDQSILLWGPRLSDDSLPFQHHPKIPPSTADEPTSQYWDSRLGIFASSPAEFASSGDLHPMSPARFSTLTGLDFELPEYTITSYGLRTRFPLVPVLYSSTLTHLAILGCEDSKRRILALLLFPRYKRALRSLFSHRTEGPEAEGASFRTVSLTVSHLCRLLGSINYADVCVLHQYVPTLHKQKDRLTMLAELRPKGPYRHLSVVVIPKWVISGLSSSGLILPDTYARFAAGIKLTLTERTPLSETTLHLYPTSPRPSASRLPLLELSMWACERCKESPLCASAIGSPHKKPFHAMVHKFTERGVSLREPEASPCCSERSWHVDTWADGSRVFPCGEWDLSLMFSPWMAGENHGTPVPRIYSLIIKAVQNTRS